MELTRRWLQFNHHRDDAEEFATRLDALMDRLRSWEGAARDDRPLSGPLFNEDVYSEWLRLTEEAVETADFLRQLSAMVRSELSRRSHATLAAQDASVSVTIADPLDEIPILPPTEEKRRAEGWILASEAAKICDVTLRYLRQERSDGFKGGEPSRGKDKRGRIWAAEGGKSKDVWYKRNSLKPRAKRKKKPTE